MRSGVVLGSGAALSCATLPVVLASDGERGFRRRLESGVVFRDAHHLAALLGMSPPSSAAGSTLEEVVAPD